MDECLVEDDDVVVVEQGRDGGCALAGAAICEERWETPDVP
jgi:hypothetical protein